MLFKRLFIIGFMFVLVVACNFSKAQERTAIMNGFSNPEALADAFCKAIQEKNEKTLKSVFLPAMRNYLSFKNEFFNFPECKFVIEKEKLNCKRSNTGLWHYQLLNVQMEAPNECAILSIPYVNKEKKIKQIGFEAFKTNYGWFLGLFWEPISVSELDNIKGASSVSELGNEICDIVTKTSSEANPNILLIDQLGFYDHLKQNGKLIIYPPTLFSIESISQQHIERCSIVKVSPLNCEDSITGDFIIDLKDKANTCNVIKLELYKANKLSSLEYEIFMINNTWYIGATALTKNNVITLTRNDCDNELNRDEIILLMQDHMQEIYNNIIQSIRNINHPSCDLLVSLCEEIYKNPLNINPGCAKIYGRDCLKAIGLQIRDSPGTEKLIEDLLCP